MRRKLGQRTRAARQDAVAAGEYEPLARLVTTMPVCLPMGRILPEREPLRNRRRYRAEAGIKRRCYSNEENGGKPWARPCWIWWFSF